ncbi:MAG: asparagine synthase C-terminal domain-containing protein, partial [Planctomycetota bacterium]
LDEAADRLRAELADAVKLRLRSDVPVGMFQSGGVDSGVVATLAAEERGSALPAGCAVGSGAGDDLDAATRTANFLNADLRHASVDAENYWETWTGLVARTAQPLATPTDVLLHRLAAAMRPDVGVVLGGEGADELLLGYAAVAGGAADYDRLNLIAADVSGLDRSAERVFLRSLRASLGRDDLESLRSPVDHYFAANSLIPREGVVGWLREGLPGREGVADAVTAEYASYFPAGRRTSRGYAELLHRVNLETLLGRLDRATMAAGLEARVPFCSHRVVEAMAAVPGDLKLRVDPGEATPYLAAPHLDGRGSLEGKRVVRRLAGQLLPAGLADRPKASFPTPVAGWLAG